MRQPLCSGLVPSLILFSARAGKHEAHKSMQVYGQAGRVAYERWQHFCYMPYQPHRASRLCQWRAFMTRRTCSEVGPHHLAGRIQDSRGEGPAQQGDQPDDDHPDGAVVELQETCQHRPGQQAARQVHEVRVQQPCTRTHTHLSADVYTRQAYTRALRFPRSCLVQGIRVQQPCGALTLSPSRYLQSTGVHTGTALALGL